MYIHSNCSFCGKPVVRKKQTKKVKNHFCDNGCKAEWQKLAKPVTREWLIEHYIDKQMNTSQIGRLVNRDPKSVWNWLKDFNIPTRPRGHNPPPVTPFGKENPFYGKKHSKETKQKIRKATLEDGRIPCMKDGVHWMKHDDYTQEDHPSWQGGLTPERQALYASEEWSEVVKKVWARDNAICQRCGKKHNTKKARGTFHIHHIISFAVKEVRTDLDNLVLLCKDCHYWIHSNKNTNNDFIKETQE